MTKTPKRDARDRAPPRSTLVKLITDLAHRHSHWQAFSDFVEMAAISISNAADLRQFEPSEARYLEIVKRYSPEELQQFPKMLGELILALEASPVDVLGVTFHELELHSHYAGQFFTPREICRMMAQMTIAAAADLNERIAQIGFVTAQEPACGAGAMVIALADELKRAGINYQQALHVTAIDIDPECVHMAYIQFSLLHIPAVVVHGNTLSFETFAHWHTPAHIFGNWSSKLRQRSERESDEHAETTPRLQAEPEAQREPPQPAQLILL